MDKATPTTPPAPASYDSVMALYKEVMEALLFDSDSVADAETEFLAEVASLAAQAAPTEEMSPEFTDTARAALLWVLWHHQGASSKVGQPIRFALGMGQHDALSEYQVREAKRWEAMAPTRDTANVPPGEWNSEPEGLTPKQAWWAGYRVGKGLPPDMPRSEAVAAQPSQAPVVQAGEYPPLQRYTLRRPKDAADHMAKDIEGQWVKYEDVKVGRASSGATTAQAVRMLTDAARDVLAERQRQIDKEGWTPEHDDEHEGWSMAVAAACYSLWDRPAALRAGRLPNLWQWTGWDQSWFKPKDPRRNLVRAAALLLAEIERLDRAGKRIPADGKIGGAA